MDTSCETYDIDDDDWPAVLGGRGGKGVMGRTLMSWSSQMASPTNLEVLTLSGSMARYFAVGPLLAVIR